MITEENKQWYKRKKMDWTPVSNLLLDLGYLFGFPALLCISGGFVLEQYAQKLAHEKTITYTIVDKDQNGVLDRGESLYLAREIGLVKEGEKVTPRRLDELLDNVTIDQYQKFNKKYQ